ncbi:MAG: hypothetical protein A4E45_00607 [Methanosaeta sp. PtaB.Bin039]|nr:MAG: hypothetical protein A4E45_00607 [Methanosaeta sp. PtaB.Bin039]OPY46887.1 MAG: hypothetical protein A4E47_00436 [Methanosaeta sp. PtaU1.Bin028]HQF17458.1 BatA domain-containing protein [Methanotrichaceae archaeon]HQI92048.1 BatA domain-containing protein [Methanotrichaceae archaeon]
MMPFRNPLALLGLLSVVPLIILYLIRPRPKEVPFSSLRFLEAGEAQHSAAWSRLITDPLFWIQLIVLISLATAAAGPYTVSPGVPGSHLVLVLDLSASMEQAFSQAVETATSSMEGYDRISIVLAENVPAVALREGSPEEASSVLSRLAPRDVMADLSSGLSLGSSLTGAEGGNILLVSDFISWSGDDPQSTRASLEASGASIVFAAVGGAADNAGIVGGWLEETPDGLKYTCRIHNYGGQRQISVKASGPGGDSVQVLDMEPGADRYFSFYTGPGLSTVTLQTEDAIEADNVAYISSPTRRDLEILYIGDEGPALAALLSLPSVTVRRSGQPAGADLVVMAKNGTADGELNRYISSGGHLIYIASGPNENPDFLPVRTGVLRNDSSTLWARAPGFASDIHFEEIGVDSYLEASARRRSTTMVEVNGFPALSYWTIGRGTVIYDGLEMGGTDFSQRPEYPIFWYNMVGWLAGNPRPADLNRKTGEVIPLGEATAVQTPGGTVITSALLLDLAGIYNLKGAEIAANLYEPRESDLHDKASYPAGQFQPAQGTQKIMENDLSPWLILAAAALVLLEMAIIRRRREV